MTCGLRLLAALVVASALFAAAGQTKADGDEAGRYCNALSRAYGPSYNVADCVKQENARLAKKPRPLVTVTVPAGTRVRIFRRNQ